MSSESSRSFLVRTYGCQMNEHDSERISGLLDVGGLKQTDLDDEADVMVLNTCCIRENADNKLYGQLGMLKRWKAERPGRQIVVSGCLAQKDREVVRSRAPWVDVVMGTHNVHRAAELLEQSRQTGPVTEILDAAVIDDSALFPSALPAKRVNAYDAWVTIQIGCDNSCSFCIVPAVRGPEISRPFDDVVDEVRLLAQQGVTEVTLLGQNVNGYGRDLLLDRKKAGEDVRAQPMFNRLLRAVGDVDGIRRVRFTSPHPKDMRAETFAAMAEVPAVCEHLHYPLQSGSDRLLAVMRRGYTAQRYLDKLAMARRMISDLAVSTDIIVGFPGETEDDFERTLEVAAAAEYDYAYTFIFSPREGTQAASMVDDFVDPAVVVERFARLRIVVERAALMRHEARIGRVEEVLVEGPSKKSADIVTGRTRQNKVVHFSPNVPVRIGSYGLVEITGAAPHHLRGEYVETTAEPSHKVRIPVSVE